MNIAMFTDSYKPQINGMVTSIDIFSAHLRKKGHNVYIFAPECKGAKKEPFVFCFKSIPFQAYREYRIGIPYKILLDPKIKKIRFDIAHVHSPFSMGASGLGFAKYHKIPVIGTFHTLFPDYMHYFIGAKCLQKIKFVKKIYKKFSWSYLSWFYNKCNVVIAPSQGIKSALLNNGIKRDVVVLPTGIETKKAKPESKSVLRKKYSKKYALGDGKIIFHAGRVTREKNIKFIIQSLKTLLKKENARLVIASDGPYKKELVMYAKKAGLEKNIIFTGYLSTDELNDFYALSDIFVLASETETQGIVLAEAALNKLPIVVLDAPVTADFVRENNVGIVSDRENFSKNVEMLMKNKKLIMGFERNSKNVRKKYDISKCTDKLLEIYMQAIKNRENRL